jgi:hypothetical protein
LPGASVRVSVLTASKCGVVRGRGQPEKARELGEADRAHHDAALHALRARRALCAASLNGVRTPLASW